MMKRKNKRPDELAFQSLIGRLKIPTSTFTTTQEVMFQSLIGRLKIRKPDELAQKEVKFQSLIGRLKILSKFLPIPPRTKVSIPYR